jgi:hypothetical protein
MVKFDDFFNFKNDVLVDGAGRCSTDSTSALAREQTKLEEPPMPVSSLMLKPRRS